MRAVLNSGTWRRAAALAAALLSASAFARADEAPRASIEPSITRLVHGERCDFKVVLSPGWLQPATVTTAVTWSVDGVPGGNETVGTIAADGAYRAPKKANGAVEIHVCGKVEGAANPNVWATVIVGKGDPAYRPSGSWSGQWFEKTGNRKIHPAKPLCIAIDCDGSLLIVEGGSVYRYTAAGQPLGRVGVKGDVTESPMAEPRMVATGPDGRIYVCDAQTGPPRVKVFSREGDRVGGFGPKGIGPGQVMQAQGMAFDPSGRLLLADSENMRINVYSKDGDLLTMWDKAGILPGQFAEPYGVVVDANGDVFVPNHYGPCQKFTPKGEYLLAFATPNPPDGVVNITAAAGDRWGNVYLAVRDSNGIPLNSVEPEPKPVRIMKYNNSGDWVTTIPLWNDERGENPMVVDGQGRLHVVYWRGDDMGVATLEPR